MLAEALAKNYGCDETAATSGRSLSRGGDFPSAPRAAVPAGRLVPSLLFGIGAADPLTMSAVAVVLILVVAAACLAPALHAARTDAAVVLRAG